MRILFVVRHPGLLRNFETGLQALAERGHETRIMLERGRERMPGQLAFVTSLAQRFEGVEVTSAPNPERDAATALSQNLRLSLDYLHYLQPRFETAPDFRRRAARDAPARMRRVMRRRPFSGPGGRRMLAQMIRSVERSMPPSGEFADEIAAYEPDIVVVSPLIWFGAPQTEWIRSARAVGVRTAACIYSWDNLTSKGAMCEEPDTVLVWNDTQAREAVELHGVESERVVPTGAQNWDYWFDREPSRTRAEFCRRVGLPDDRPFLLYLESSGYVGGERPFLPGWIRRMRALGGARLADASVLVRPHPQVRSHDWSSVGLDDLDNVIAWPRKGTEPIAADSRDEFFDSLYHCHATVGVNTSAFIESAIVGRPSVALLMPRFRKGQLGTVHFHYLLESNGGPVAEAVTYEEQAAALERALEADQDAGPPAQKFVASFVRPFGLEVRAGDRFADAVEDACARRPRPGQAPLIAPAVRLAARTTLTMSGAGR